MSFFHNKSTPITGQSQSNRVRVDRWRFHPAVPGWLQVGRRDTSPRCPVGRWLSLPQARNGRASASCRLGWTSSRLQKVESSFRPPWKRQECDEKIKAGWGVGRASEASANPPAATTNNACIGDHAVFPFPFGGTT